MYASPSPRLPWASTRLGISLSFRRMSLGRLPPTSTSACASRPFTNWKMDSSLGAWRLTRVPILVSDIHCLRRLLQPFGAVAWQSAGNAFGAQPERSKNGPDTIAHRRGERTYVPQDCRTHEIDTASGAEINVAGSGEGCLIEMAAGHVFQDLKFSQSWEWRGMSGLRSPAPRNP